jgi:GNAT superfamily N-acetyltransferase
MVPAPVAVIRPVTGEELPFCADMLRRAFHTPAVEFGLTVENCPTNAAFVTTERLERDRQRGQRQFGAYLDGVQVGFFALWSRDGAVWELKKVGVVPEHRHAGIGTAIVNQAAREAAALGGVSLHIGIIEESTALKDWYSRLGFVHVGTTVFDQLPFTVGYMEMALQDFRTTTTP